MAGASHMNLRDNSAFFCSKNRCVFSQNFPVAKPDNLVQLCKFLVSTNYYYSYLCKWIAVFMVYKHRHICIAGVDCRGWLRYWNVLYKINSSTFMFFTFYFV